MGVAKKVKAAVSRKKPAVKKAPVVKTKNAVLKEAYNKGATIADLAEKHRMTEDEVYNVVVTEVKE